MPGPGSVACPKPEPRKRTKARRDRAEAAVLRAVYTEVNERDGYCRLEPPAAQALLGCCEGPSTLAHLGEHRRFKTRGMAPEQRHSEGGSLKLCRGHHQGPRGYDRHGFEIEPKTPDGAVGPLRFVRADGAVYEEGDVDS